MRRITSLTIPSTLLWVATSAIAHHGSAPFDGDRRVTVEGVITKFEYRNPHSFINLRATDSAGDQIDVRIEAAGATGSYYGLTADSLIPGDVVTAVMNPSWQQPDEWGLGVEVFRQDGTIVPLSGRYARDLDQSSTGVATSIAGVWLPRSEDFFNFVTNRRSLPLTEEGTRSMQAFDIRNSSQAKCIPYPPPTLMLYSAINAIEILADRVLIHSDWMDGERVIHIGESDSDTAHLPALHGYSVGHWEGRTLVVETTDFSENNSGIASGVVSGPRKHMLERFTLDNDGSGIAYSFVLEDSDTLTESISGGSRWEYRPDLEPGDVACDLESAGRYLTE